MKDELGQSCSLVDVTSYVHASSWWSEEGVHTPVDMCQIHYLQKVELNCLQP
jgi:hypothetical protein